jgi:hypothetical protein
MALIACPECGQGISEHAPTCPRCGYPLKEPQVPVQRVVVRGGSNKRAWGFEWRTKAQILGWPLIHVAIGRDPQTLRLRVARGVIAVGQFGVGVITVAQFGFGLLFGLGQCVGGYLAVGQLALGLHFGLGQFAIGMTAIGQFAFGRYVLAQIGVGSHVWSTAGRDPEAVRYFTALWDAVKGFLEG